LVLPKTSANDQGRQLARRKAESRKQKTEMSFSLSAFDLVISAFL
jgi:hypothetical protein